jgi:hypothetical protein
LDLTRYGIEPNPGASNDYKGREWKPEHSIKLAGTFRRLFESESFARDNPWLTAEERAALALADPTKIPADVLASVQGKPWLMEHACVKKHADSCVFIDWRRPIYQPVIARYQALVNKRVAEEKERAEHKRKREDEAQSAADAQVARLREKCDTYRRRLKELGEPVTDSDDAEDEPVKKAPFRSERWKKRMLSQQGADGLWRRTCKFGCGHVTDGYEKPAQASKAIGNHQNQTCKMKPAAAAAVADDVDSEDE